MKVTDITKYHKVTHFTLSKVSRQLNNVATKTKASVNATYPVIVRYKQIGMYHFMLKDTQKSQNLCTPPSQQK